MFVTHKSENSVEYLASSIIKSTHAFSTRIGGVSGLAHTSALNLAFNRGDDRDTVIENLARFGEAVGFDAKNVISLPQIHSSTVIDVDVQMAGEGYFKDAHTSCDGYVTSKSKRNRFSAYYFWYRCCADVGFLDDSIQRWSKAYCW